MSVESEIERCLPLLLEEDNYFKNLFKNYNVKNIKSNEFTEILKVLSSVLLDVKFTRSIVKYFRTIFLEVLQIAIDLNNSENKNVNISIRNAVILSELLELHPDTADYVLKYYEKFPAPFTMSVDENEKRRKIDVESYDDYDIIKACLKFLKFNPEYFKNNWNWSEFFEKYQNIKDIKTRWIFCKCVAIYTGMSELNFHKYLEMQFTQKEIIECEVNDSNRDNLKELITIQDTSNKNHSDFIINIICNKHEHFPNADLVEVQSTKGNLENLALAIVSGKAVSLLGSVGSGKTSLVEYVALKAGRILGKDFIKVQLGDQTDSKMLLGTYVSTDIPGEFVWQPGILTQAVIEGSWILLEDLDSASLDIACVLRGLIENNYLTVPGYRDYLQIKPGFHLFTTQRLISTASGYHKKHTSSNNLLDKHFLNVNIKPLTETELIEIIRHKYPILATISTRIVNVFTKLTESVELNSQNGRLISTRDLFKWCARSIIDYDVSSQNSALKVLQDAIDTFCCFLPEVEDRFKFAKIISTNLGIVDEKAKYFCYNHKPNMHLNPEYLNIGRASIKRFDILVNKGNFCFTRPTTCLLERIILCINLNEPILLVGETGTGKTTAVQFLAQTVGHKLTVINMNQQSDSADLLGGYKPVDLKYIINPIKKEFESVFKSYFNPSSNKQFLVNINHCYNENLWETLYKLMKKSYDAAIKRLKDAKNEKDLSFLNAWKSVGQKLSKFQMHLKHKNVLAFNFVEGSLVRAVLNGHWVLLDEINLANAETLECLSGLLESASASINLLERGDKKQIKRHENFKLFACMNPSTDVGKKDLPAGLRNRFTEFFVEELMDRHDLILLINNYLQVLSLPATKIENIVKFYLHIRQEAITKLNDGLGHRPHFSLRSLCRALSIAAKNPCGVFNRSLYEAFCLSFLTQLDAGSYTIVEGLITRYLLGGIENKKAVVNQPIARPRIKAECIQFEGYWIVKGDLEVYTQDDYILTKSVKNNLRDLVRIVSIGRLPVLLQGNTSVGKTSLITYLAKASGYKCVRINNHEHTDLQEYVGTYVADQQGKLIFQKGLLVEAMINGHWLILDELNLAPSDVLEALNRVLDDNRELFIPETQETIKAHPNFMLFATQNPPGLYGGRKMLSRAFRNRFVELHFEEIPHDELQIILQEKCAMAPSYAKKMINVFKDLQVRRRGSATFSGKYGFITLRDLFRWGERYRLANITEKFYDWDQHLADEGYLLLAGKVRKIDERNEIALVIEKNLKRKIIPDNLFNLSETTSPVSKSILTKLLSHEFKGSRIVWTQNMRMLAVLVYKALEFNEPVLLVGETGGGKTTLCSVLAECNNQDLVTLNCHMHTESSDFIGGLRPIRDHSEENLNKIFEWVDGPLVQALLKGSLFLADEISLADDSVLERLNSLLEPERTLLLAEKGCDMKDAQTIVAHESFRFIGTMNPGGDYGKKELSPALRNRFTEIWCETCNNTQDLLDIVAHNLNSLVDKQEIAAKMIKFVEWFKAQEIGKRFLLNVRDLITWANFINITFGKIGITLAYYHGVCLTLLDNLGCGNTSQERFEDLEKFNENCINFISEQFNENISFELKDRVKISRDKFGIHPFYITFGEENVVYKSGKFVFDTPNTQHNALCLLRGLQMKKPILLEGSPGVGKSSLVVALAKASGNRIFRINLSDQTDISDLFGADLPVEGGNAGEFSWKDGPLLQALKQSCWILLDELNLASQSVLEGLNACLDHRGEIFIPELGKTFYVQKGTKFFGCQNPVKQGGARKGLPQSFLNRFTQIYLKPLSDKDVLLILYRQFPDIDRKTLENMVLFNSKINEELKKGGFGLKGGPFEFNLRDIMRWCQTLNPNQDVNADSTVELIYASRLRTQNDTSKMEEIFKDIFNKPFGGLAPVSQVTKNTAYFGDVHVSRGLDNVNQHVLNQVKEGLLLRDQVHVFRKLSYCIKFKWLAILVGPSAVGKTEIVKTLAKLTGKTLRTLAVTSAMDTTDIIGGFEQTNFVRHLEEMLEKTKQIVYRTLQKHFLARNYEDLIILLQKWEKITTLNLAEDNAVTTSKFLQKLNCLTDLWKNFENSLDDKDTNKINNLRKQSLIVKKNVENENSLNSGGKFEWIDSILVKCLQEGSWLLIDDVNLCNAAVLDRLNALLEPDGVLTINERGLNDKCEMVQIKPHEDFRLFFTMDPKNGEISRAMRNRGVEIYVSSIDNPLDIKSLINKQGLNNIFLIESLMEVHNFICSSTLGENPNLENILQSAFLISQQIKRGLNIKQTFIKTIMEVYINLKQPAEFSVVDIKLNLISKIEEIFAKNKNDIDFDENTTLSTAKLEISSQKEHIMQQIIPIQQYNQGNFYLHILHFLMHVSSDDRVLRLRLLRQKFGYVLDEEFETFIKHFLELRCPFIESHLPTDWRWIPETYYKYSYRTELEKAEYSVNQLLVELYFMLYKMFNLDTYEEIKKNEKFSILSYLNTARNKKLQLKFDDPILINILDLLRAYDRDMTQKIYCRMPTNEVPSVLRGIHYRFILHKFLSIKISNLNEFDETYINNLHMYYKWFEKALRKYKPSFFAASYGMELEALDETVTKINGLLPNYLCFLSRFCKRYWKRTPHPNAPKDVEEIEKHQHFKAIMSTINFYDKTNKVSFKDAVSEIKNRDRLLSIETPKVNTNILQLFSILDYFCLLQIINYRNNMNVETIKLFAHQITIPVKLLHTALNYGTVMESSLLPGLKTEISSYLKSSASMKPTDFGFDCQFLNPHISTLSYLCSNFILEDINKDGFIVTTELGKLKDFEEFYDKVGGVLWKNLMQLADDDYDYINMEVNYLNMQLNLFMEELCKTMGIKSSNNLENIIKNLKLKLSISAYIDKENFLVEFLSLIQALTTNWPISDEISVLNQISNVYIILNYLRAFLTSKVSRVDPLHKKVMEYECYKSIISAQNDLAVSFKEQNNFFSSTTKTLHPLTKFIENYIEKVKAEPKYLTGDLKERPGEIKYHCVLKVLDDAFDTILAPNKIKEVYLELENIFKNINCSNDTSLTSKINQYKAISYSYDNLITSLENYRINFPDIIEPVLRFISEFQHGLNLKLSLLIKMLQRNECAKMNININDCLKNLVKIPILNKECNSYKKIVGYCTDINLRKLLRHILNDEILYERLSFTLLKSSLIELNNICAIEGKFSPILRAELFEEFYIFTNSFVEIWKKQEEAKSLKKQEEESLYKMKTKCDPTSDEEISEKEFKTTFPTYFESDFADIEVNNVMEDDNEMELNFINKEDDLIEINDIIFIAKMHSEFVINNSKCEWLATTSNSVEVDDTTPFLQRLKLFKLLMQKIGDGTSYKIDKEIVSSLGVLVSIAKHFQDDKNLNEEYNFYKDANVGEAKSCIYILQDLLLKIDELLQEWPDFPLLQNIKLVAKRILSFDVKSPITRFLTGFDILLKLCHDWEQNAHAGVSISAHIVNVSQQLITWRKLEMKNWKSALDTTFNRLNENAWKYWFFFYDLTKGFICEKNINASDLIKTLENFILQSSLAEFQTRVKLLYIFHCHGINLSKNVEQEQFNNILWNLYKHYEQFLPLVQERVRKIRIPIEKKLNDYIKIVKWKDISYWALKDTLDKTHKTIYKFMREYKDSLLEKVTCLVVNSAASNPDLSSTNGHNIQDTNKFLLDSKLYTSKLKLTKIHDDEEALLSVKYYEQSKKLSKKLIIDLSYQDLIRSLDDFTTNVILTMEHLQNLQPQANISKEKRLSQVKGHIQQKQRALSELFKTLSKIGISFRKGLIENKQSSSVEYETMTPIDIKAALSYLPKLECDDKLLILWDGAEKYYNKTTMRLKVLEEVFKNPHKDLGLQNLERCRGFSYNLFTLLNEQKSKLSLHLSHFYSMRYYLNIFKQIQNENNYIEVSKVSNLRCVLQNILIITKQYGFILNTYCSDDVNTQPIPILNSNKKFIEYKNDALWKEVNECFSKVHILSKKLLHDLLEIKYVPFNNVDQPTYTSVGNISTIVNETKVIVNLLKKSSDLFEDLPIGDSSKWAYHELFQVLKTIDCVDLERINYDIHSIKKNCDEIIKSSLISMQNIFRKYKDSKILPESDEDLVHDKHFSELFMKNIFDDLKTLNVENVLSKIKTLANNIKGTHPNHFEYYIMNTTPFLEQLVLLYEYFISQLVSGYRTSCKMASILNAIFIELSTKGFCIPPDLSDEIDKEGEGKTSQGMGLADGEGEKNVSDRIESEDQLEDTEIPGQEKNEEDKDCKEDKGIEMSEDFDSKLQDMENKPDDDDNQSSADSGDEQMGEVDDNAEQLDKEVWGSDNEDEEENQDNDEKGTGGENLGEDTLAASDSKVEDKEDNDNSNKDKEEHKKDINEMDDPDYDDDQVDPYHGNQPELPEPEDLDLSEDLNLDDGDEKNQEDEEPNEMDIDAIKDKMPDIDESEQLEEEQTSQNSEDKDDASEGSDGGNEDDSDTEENEAKKETNEIEESIDKNKDDDNEDLLDNNKSGGDQQDTNEEKAETTNLDNKNSNDNVETDKSVDKTESRDSYNQSNKEEEGVGQSDMQNSETGHSGQSQKKQSSNISENNSLSRNKPSKSKSERSLGDVSQPARKKMKTMEHHEDNTERNDNEDGKQNESADLYQHIKEAKEMMDQVYDSVTNDEQAEQERPEIGDENNEKMEENANLIQEEESEDVEMTESKEVRPEKKEKQQKTGEKLKEGIEGEGKESEKTEIEGDLLETQTVSRIDESSYHTQYNQINYNIPISIEDVFRIRNEVESELSKWHEAPSNFEAEQAWEKISSLVSSLARDLSEQLRLVLEPTQLSHLKGDYRTGRRINMRKIIPYIASQFRKDKIWLRRTKPQKRDYQIVLAIDDSSSMADNHSKELAFESVALISKALTLLESGQLSVLSFGECTQILHKLSDTFTDKSGIKLLQKFTFEQKKTCVAKLLNFVTEMFNSTPSSHSRQLAKLLIIVSDGRGIFSEGESVVQQAVRLAKQSNIFLVFVIVDNPISSSSILDIRKPVFKNGNVVEIMSYMDSFPFPFYVILRDINTLPSVLSDALRQWFEIVSNADQ